MLNFSIKGIAAASFSEDRQTFAVKLATNDGEVTLTFPATALPQMAAFFTEAEQKAELLGDTRMAGERSSTPARIVERLEVETGMSNGEYFIVILFAGGTLRHHYSLTYPLATELHEFLGDKLRNRPTGNAH